jgi:hypothetical protein
MEFDRYVRHVIGLLQAFHDPGEIPLEIHLLYKPEIEVRGVSVQFITKPQHGPPPNTSGSSRWSSKVLLSMATMATWLASARRPARLCHRS